MSATLSTTATIITTKAMLNNAPFSSWTSIAASSCSGEPCAARSATTPPNDIQ
jgi:hypothetical protein